METDIILEGFQKSEEMHGVRYMQFIGDGDSFVHPTLLYHVTGWEGTSRKWNAQIILASAIAV